MFQLGEICRQIRDAATHAAATWDGRKLRKAWSGEEEEEDRVSLRTAPMTDSHDDIEESNGETHETHC